MTDKLPLARAVVTCDHPGCAANIIIQTQPGGAAETDIAFDFGRKVAEALGWQCDEPGEPDKSKRLPAPDGYERAKDGPELQIADGRDLCPEHRKDKQ